jgi:hypothetical protein
MLLLAERALRVVFLVLGAGLLAAVLGFALTSQTPGYTYLGPLCASNDVHPGFDPWTGEPYGRSFDLTPECWTEHPGPQTRVVGDFPDELVGRWAIPLPLGFAIGSVAMVGALLVVDIRRRGPSGDADIEGAIPV